MTRKVKFLDPKIIEKVLAEVADVARCEGLELAVIGGVAMMLYGSDRLTHAYPVHTLHKNDRN